MDVRVGPQRRQTTEELMLHVVLEKTLESHLDCKEIQPVHPKGNQSWIFTGRTDAKAETLILWPPDAKNWFIRKDPDAGKDWKQEEKGMTEGEMVGWHHWLNGHGFGWTPGVGDGQGGLACCDSWSHRVGYNWATELNWKYCPVNALLVTKRRLSFTVKKPERLTLIKWSKLTSPLMKGTKAVSPQMECNENSTSFLFHFCQRRKIEYNY